MSVIGYDTALRSQGLYHIPFSPNQTLSDTEQSIDQLRMQGADGSRPDVAFQSLLQNTLNAGEPFTACFFSIFHCNAFYIHKDYWRNLLIVGFHLQKCPVE